MTSSIFWRSILAYFWKRNVLLQPLDNFFIKIVWISLTYVYVFKYPILLLLLLLFKLLLNYIYIFYILKKYLPHTLRYTQTLVALVLFGDVPKWSGQGHFEDTSGTRPGRVRDMSVRGHIFRQFWARTWGVSHV